MSAYQYDVSIKDAKGKIGHYRLFFRKIDSADVLTTTDIQTYSDRLTASIDAMIDGQIMEVRASLPLTLPDGLKTAPVATADREEGITFYWLTTPSRDVIHNRLPTFAESFLRSDGSLVDPLPTAVDGFIQLVSHSEEIPLVVSACSDKNEDIVDVVLDQTRENFKSR